MLVIEREGERERDRVKRKSRDSSIIYCPAWHTHCISITQPDFLVKCSTGFWSVELEAHPFQSTRNHEPGYFLSIISLCLSLSLSVSIFVSLSHKPLSINHYLILLLILCYPASLQTADITMMMFLLPLLLHLSTSITINTPLGRVTSLDLQTTKGTIHEFYELPYAARHRRWTHSRLREKHWKGVKDASQYTGIKCIQGYHSTYFGTGTEDCLVLTVRTPNTTPSTPLPVMVWIHGGSLRVGWGEEPGYAPDAELTSEVNAVTVTINYRLDVMGFLQTADLARRGNLGNYGIGDALTALRWIRANVASFGGDPGAVTLLGESSGAAVIYGLLGSEKADGMFDKAILLSGPQTLITTPAQACTIRANFTRDAGCGCCNKTERIQCLRQANTTALAKAFFSYRGYGFYDFPYGYEGIYGESMDFAVLDGTLVTSDPFGVESRARNGKVELYISNTAQETAYNVFYGTNAVETWEEAIILLMKKRENLRKTYKGDLSKFPRTALNIVAEMYDWNKTSDTWWPQLFLDTVLTDIRTTCLNNNLVESLNRNHNITARRVYISQRVSETYNVGGGVTVPWSSMHGWDTEALFGYGYYTPLYSLTTTNQDHNQKFLRNLRDFVGSVVWDKVSNETWPRGETLHFTNEDFPGSLRLEDEPPQEEQCEKWEEWDMLNVALISRHGARTGNPPLPGILTVDLTHALSAVFGIGVLWLGSNQCFTLLCTAALVSLPPAILWIMIGNGQCLRQANTTALAKAFFSYRGYGFYDFPYGYEGIYGESMDFAVLDGTLVTSDPFGVESRARNGKVELYISNTAQETAYNVFYGTNAVETWEEAIILLMKKRENLRKTYKGDLSKFPRTALNIVAEMYDWNKTSDTWWPQLFLDTVLTDIRTTCLNNNLVESLNRNHNITARRVYISQRVSETYNVGGGVTVPWSSMHGWDTEALFGYGYYTPLYSLTTTNQDHNQKFLRNLRDFVGSVVWDKVSNETWPRGETLHFTNEDFPGSLRLEDEPPQEEQCEKWEEWDMLKLKNDLSKDYPYLLMENSNFGKNLIDTDAQVIVIANLIYVVLVAVCHGLHCFFLVGLGQRSDELTIERCGLIYSAGVVLSSAVCIVIRPIISNDAICYKVCCILLITCGTIASLFFLSETDNYLGKYILSYCTIISACQLMEDFIEVAITRYYDSINLPAFKSFSVQDYINSKVGFLHGIGAAAGSLIFGLLVNDMDIETAIFTVTAIFTTLAVVTAPLSTLFIAAELR
eukprot:sb/3461169/